MSYPRNHTVIEGSNLILQCAVTAANPLPNITWYHALARNTEISNSGRLNFINISRDQSGQYYCVATNGIGLAVISRMSTIDVQCKYHNFFGNFFFMHAFCMHSSLYQRPLDSRTTTSTRFDLKFFRVFSKYRLPAKLHFTIFH